MARTHTIAARVAVALIVLVVLAGCARPSPTPDAVAVADAHVAAGTYTAAEAAYREALAAHPDDPQPALKLAALYARWERPQAGLTALTEAQQRGAPTEAVIPLRLRLLVQAGAWASVQREGEAYLVDHPDDAQTLALVTRALLRQHRCAAAEEAAARWHQAAPEDPAAAQTRAALSGGTDPQADLPIGRRLIRQEQWGAAACVLTRITTAAPDFAEAHAWLGEALARTQHPQEAREHLVTATTLAPDQPLGWLLLGTHELAQGRVEAAHDALLRAHRLDPDNPAPCLTMAQVKAHAGAYNEVDIWAEAALARAPQDAEVWKAVARFYLQRNLLQSAMPARAVQGAVQRAPQDPETLTLLGWLRLAEGDAAAARTALDRALALDPDRGEAHYLRGQALQQLGDTAAAQAALTRAADLGYRP